MVKVVEDVCHAFAERDESLDAAEQIKKQSNALKRLCNAITTAAAVGSDDDDDDPERLLPDMDTALRDAYHPFHS